MCVGSARFPSMVLKLKTHANQHKHTHSPKVCFMRFRTVSQVLWINKRGELDTVLQMASTVLLESGDSPDRSPKSGVESRRQ